MIPISTKRYGKVRFSSSIVATDLRRPTPAESALPSRHASTQGLELKDVVVRPRISPLRREFICDFLLAEESQARQSGHSG